MARLALTVVVALVALTLSTPAFAFQCPKLVKQINDATANRYDAAATTAKVAAKESEALHAAGKHAESEKLAKETLASLGIKS